MRMESVVSYVELELRLRWFLSVQSPDLTGRGFFVGPHPPTLLAGQPHQGGQQEG